MWSKRLKLNTGTVLALSMMLYFVYSLLLSDNITSLSLAAILSYAHHLPPNKHLIVLGILPIYIAAMLFGAVVAGFYLGAKFQTLIIKRFGTKSPLPE
jgi:hypothetical protein